MGGDGPFLAAWPYAEERSSLWYFQPGITPIYKRVPPCKHYVSPHSQNMASSVVQLSRPHDHLYDPIHTTADQRDHWRAQNRATQARLERVQEFNHFFSEVQAIYPRHSIRLKTTDTVPRHISRDWTGPTGAEPSVDYKMATANVNSRNRYKYFRRPVVPILNSAPPEVVLAGQQAEMNGNQSMNEVDPMIPVRDPSPEARTRTVSVQSMYREANIQTDPFTPDYTLRPGAQPEILTVATLVYDNGLPPGTTEVEMIERARWKRQFEATLPPITDESAFELRRKLMQDQELKEWGDREREMVRLHEERLEEIRAALEERSDEKERFNEMRVDHIEQKKIIEQEEVAAEIQRRRIKALRKTTRLRDEMMPQTENPSVVDKYADLGSLKYAPIARNGGFPDKFAHKFETEVVRDLNYHGVLELENFMPQSTITPNVIVPSRKPRPQTSSQRKMVKIGKALETIDQLIKTGKVDGEPSEMTGDEMQVSGYKPKKLQERPPTPERPPATEDIEQTNALILIQRMLRGRAVQNEMYDGKEKRFDLIKELRTTDEDIVTAEEEDADNANMLDDVMVNTTAETLQGEFVGMTMDYLSKELVRFQEEKKIAAYVDSAERLRRQREAEESGRRQDEELLRMREQYQYEAAIDVNAESAETFVDSSIAEMVDRTAADWAIEETLAEEANSHSQMRHLNMPANREIQHLLTQFLYPEVEREQVRRRVNVDQKKYAEAVRKAVYAAIVHAEDEKDQFLHGLHPSQK